MRMRERISNVMLVGSVLAPLIVDIDTNLYVMLISWLSVYVACYRCLTPPTTIKEADPGGFASYIVHPISLCAVFILVCTLVAFYTRPVIHIFMIWILNILGISALSYILMPAISHCLPKKWNEDVVFCLRFPHRQFSGVSFTKSEIVRCVIVALIACFRLVYDSPKHWLVKNIYDVAWCIMSIEIFPVSSFKSACFYASFLLPTGPSNEPLCMFDYRDLTSSGVFLAFLLRFDSSSSGGKTQYFNSAFLGYTTGLILKVTVKGWLQLPYPDLLFIGPCIFGFLAVYFIWKGDNQQLMTFTDTKEAPENQQRSPRRTKRRRRKRRNTGY